MTSAICKQRKSSREAVGSGPRPFRTLCDARRDVVFVTIWLWSETARLRTRSRL
jgi:hypothetical protein